MKKLERLERSVISPSDIGFIRRRDSGEGNPYLSTASGVDKVIRPVIWEGLKISFDEESCPFSTADKLKLMRISQRRIQTYR